jgi:hypothetical protein
MPVPGATHHIAAARRLARITYVAEVSAAGVTVLSAFAPVAQIL